LAFGARLRMTSAISLGSDGHLPRQIRLPSRRIEIAVSFKDTSRPIKSSKAVLRSMLGPDHHVLSPFFHHRGTAASLEATATQPPTNQASSRDYPMSQHPAVAKVLGELQAAMAANPLPG